MRREFWAIFVDFVNNYLIYSQVRNKSVSRIWRKAYPVWMRLILATVNNAGTSFVLNQLRSGFNFAIGIQREYSYRSASILCREQEFPGKMHCYMGSTAVANGSRVYKLDGTVVLDSVSRYARALIVLSDRIQVCSFGMQS